MRNHILSVIALAALGCKGSHESTIAGAVQKGPFVLGSAINVALVDDAGAPTGLVFPTTTSDDLGAFEVTLPETGLVSIHADGFWFNEVTGSLSAASISLDAFADSSSDAPVFVNMVTHLSHARAARLLADGSSFEDAVAQAEGEMRTALSIGTDGFDPGAPGTSMNALGGDTDANAYGLAVSAVLVQAAIDEAGADGPIDATLQQLVNTFASDLADDGLVAPTLTTQIDGAQANVDVAGVEGNLAQRVTDLGGSEVVADLDRAIDSDLDGLANATDNCPALTNADQVDADSDGIGDACQCGDGTKSPTEACDDGNLIDGDACEADCTLPACGNGIDDLAEDCFIPLGDRMEIPNTWTIARFEDFNGDGEIDVLVLDTVTNDLLVVDGLLSGTLNERDVLPTGITSASLTIGVCDVDGEGNPDVVAFVTGDKNEVITWTNDENGVLALADRHSIPTAYDRSPLTDADGSIVVLARDLDGSPVQTVARWSWDGTKMTPGPSSPLEVDRSGHSDAWPAVLADIDQDGFGDIVVDAYYDVPWFAGDEAGAFTEAGSLPGNPVAGTNPPAGCGEISPPNAGSWIPFGPALAHDIDGDGVVEVFAQARACDFDSAAGFWRDAGTGYSWNVGEMSGSGRYGWSGLIDLAGDGRYEIVGAYSIDMFTEGGAISPIRPDGSVGERRTLGIVGTPYWADADGDGDIDAVTLGWDNSTSTLSLGVYENDP